MRIFLLPLILFLLLCVGLDWYILRQIKRRAPKRLYIVVTALLYAMIVVAICLPRRGEASILPVMWMLYAYLTVYIPKIIYVLFSLIGRIPRIWHRRSLHLGMMLGVPLAILVFCTMWWGAIFGRREIQVHNVEIASERVPRGFDGYRIVQFSDMHVGTWGNDTTFVSCFVDSINALKPDLILFTGDIVNRRTEEIQPFVSVLSRLKARDGVYSILGNHDYGDYADWPSAKAKQQNLDDLIRIQGEMGWKMLNNGHAFLTSGKDTVALVGVENWGEPPFSVYGDLNKAYPKSQASRYNQNDSLFKILLSHNPEHWHRVARNVSNFDLTLSGHTHAMQMMLSVGRHRWSPSQYKYDEWGGLYTYDPQKPASHPLNLYVNIGGGEVGMPYRIGAAPEITVITLNRKGK